MRLGIVGCGFVADFYAKTRVAHPELELVAVTDRDPERLAHFAEHHGVASRPSLDALLADPRVDLVLNLTNPRSHFEVSRACLEAGKHVYSEKPLAMKTADAEALVDLAERRGLTLSGAPCSLLGETAQTVWKALRERAVGDVRLVYAEQDDGPVHRMAYRSWKSESGLPWPWKDEFEIGCTIEHAGYYLTWLPAFFGPVRRVTAYSTCLVPDKRTDAPLDGVAPDLSIATLEFDSGVVARLTCSLFATHDHGLRIFGEDGVLGTEDCWRYGSPVWKRRYHDIRRRTILTPWKSRVPLVRKWDPPFRYRGSQAMDFCRGVAEMADAIGAGRTPRLSARYCLHVNEVVLAISNAGPGGASHEIRSRFDPIEPMPWAV